MRLKRARPDQDREFWTQVFADHLDDMLNYFVFRVGSKDNAEDLCSAAFERAWAKRHQFDATKGSPRTWLLAIASTVGRNHARAARPESCGWNLEIVDERHREPGEALLRSEAIADVRRAVSELSARERELIALKYGGHETNRGISRITGLSESNVGTIIHRSLRKLRMLLEEEEANGTG